MAIRDNDRPTVVLHPEQAAEPGLDMRNNPIGRIATQSAQLKENDRWKLNHRCRQQAPVALPPSDDESAFRSWQRSDRMSSEESEIDDRAQRFRDAALPHLDEVYTAARYLLRNTNDAEDAVQECYLRALRHFDGYRGPAMKPWLLAILRNVCNAEFVRRASGEVPTDYAQDESAVVTMPMWQEPQTSLAKVMQQQDSARIWRLVAELPEPFREAIVLREINDLSYKEIAQVAGVQVGTVMSRLARARSLLRTAWNLQEKLPA
jgi:RNA polymerase sigma-70 factor, ECF subfamily